MRQEQGGYELAVSIIGTFLLRKLFHVAHDLGVLPAHAIYDAGMREVYDEFYRQYCAWYQTR